MNNLVIQSLWVGSKISPIEQLCIKSFLDNGHQFHLYVYDLNIEGCPRGTIFKDANEIIPSEDIFKDVINGYTSFADWFRYNLLYERGGWWVDMDIICLKYFDMEDDYCFTTELAMDYRLPEIIVNNSVIKAPKQAEFLGDMLKYMSGKDLKNAKWGEFGPRFLDRVLREFDSAPYIHPPKIFCPLNWHQVNLLFDDDLVYSLDSSFAIHLWNNIWTKHGYNKYSIYPQNSILERLKSRYGIIDQ